ncbi:hypothetical protein N22_034 [Idiomarinaceae phage 1N2-2]|uniref:hypothetical protein n=1 Tax=Idiomarinaceae phage 1N2-2 TaxID=1536592 RepID=UPI0004F62687|nr:hypothetical protein N22_034 [Idiomarinaceae phage 1N2-2]AIM40736.1 hypothetical protein N22_034 [Idiomarinaceae phage 1N2-2]
MEAMMTTVGMYSVKLDMLGDNYRVTVSGYNGHYESVMHADYQTALAVFKARVSDLRSYYNA